jgi:hypothetical protein
VKISSGTIIDFDIFSICEATFLGGRDTVGMDNLNELKTNNNGYLYRCHSEGNNLAKTLNGNVLVNFHNIRLIEFDMLS